MKLFISFQFDEITSGRVARHAAALRDLATGGVYPPEENYHVTLAFIGECERRNVARVLDAIREATAGVAPFTISIGRAGCFEKPEGRIVYLEADGGGTLRQLHTALGHALEARGFVLPDDDKRRDFRPHVTIGQEVAIPDGDLGKLPADIFVCRVTRVSLMLSARVHGRTRYSELEHVDLV